MIRIVPRHIFIYIYLHIWIYGIGCISHYAVFVDEVFMWFGRCGLGYVISM